MAYLITHPSTSLKTRSVVERMWCKNLVGIPSVATVLAWGASVWQFSSSNIFASMFLGGVGAVSGSVPTWYYGRFLRKKQMKFFPYKDSALSTKKEWSDMLINIFTIEDELYEYVKTLHPDDFAYAPAYNAWRNVCEVQWEAIEQYERMAPYLNNVRVTTKDILKEELGQIALYRDRAQAISDQIMHIGIRSASFTKTVDKSHLEVLVRELEYMATSMDELNGGAFELPAVTTESRHHDAYIKSESHKVRGA